MGLRGPKPGSGAAKGRKPGALNRSTIAREISAKQGLEAARMAGELPLDVILRAMHGDTSITPAQYKAAVDAAPYCHPKLSSVNMDAPADEDMSKITDEELMRIVRAGELPVDEEDLPTLN